MGPTGSLMSDGQPPGQHAEDDPWNDIPKKPADIPEKPANCSEKPGGISGVRLGSQSAPGTQQGQGSIGENIHGTAEEGTPSQEAWPSFGKSLSACEQLRSASVPKAVVSRLSLYLREVEQLVHAGQERVSSRQLGRLLGVTDAQVRKDFAHFGQFGYRGIGYRTLELAAALKTILGTDQEWPAAMVGVGNLGRALLGYRGFQRRGFRIVAVFDNDPTKINTQLDGHLVYPVDQVPLMIPRLQVNLGLLVVPAPAAQRVADLLVVAGVRGILNFAPVTVSAPPSVSVVSVDLSVHLEQLAFAVQQQPLAGSGQSESAEPETPRLSSTSD